MGRRQDSMVARFVSFGQGGPQHRSSHPGKAVEMQKMPQRIIAVPSIDCLAHFPPLGAVPPRARSPVFSTQVPGTRSDGDSKGMARIAAQARFTDDTADTHSLRSSQSYDSLGNGKLPSNGHMPDMSRTQADWLRAQLQDAQLRCETLQKQLKATNSVTTSPAKANSDTVPAAGKQLQQRQQQQQQQQLLQQPQQQQQQPQQPQQQQQHQEEVQQQLQELQQQLRQQEQQLQAAQLQMAHVQQTAQQLLTTFQQHGYEVAAGLDSLQDDLDELEQWSDARKKQLDQGLAVEDPLSAEPFSSPPGTPQKPRPSLEKMVMLRARREHVEAAYLDLARFMVSGLEGLVQKCK